MKYTYKTKPYKHQVKALRKIVKTRGGLLAMPMRSGKTKTAIDWVCVMYLKFFLGGKMKVLVVCPLSVKGVWKSQIRMHMPDDFKGKIKWKIINYERAYARKQVAEGWEPIPRKKLYQWKPDIIIVDEAHKLGNPTTVQSRHVYKLRKKTGARALALTGTPFHRKPMMIYGIFKFIDERIFNTSWAQFKNYFGKWAGYDNWKFVGVQNKDELMKKMKPLTFMMRTLPLVPPQHEVVPFKLEESEHVYEQMAEESIALIDDGYIEAPIALVRALRLAQICSGGMRDSEGQIRRAGREKRRALEGLVEQFSENEVQKFVVFSRFTAVALKDIVEVCRGAGYKVYLMYGKTPSSLREQRLAEFDETTDRAVFVSQTATGSLGIDLSAAAISVFYSLPESLVTYDQCVNRIRKWKDKRTLTYYYLVGEGTIEEVHIAAHNANLELIKVLEEDPMLLSYRARG